MTNSPLLLTHHRFYYASLGRWLSRDPIAEQGGINLYGYVGGNAVNRVDPLGLSGETQRYYLPNSPYILGSPANKYWAKKLSDFCDRMFNQSDDTDLTGHRKKHILDGDKKGGGHRHGTGKSGKTEFPPEWSDEKILDAISDVATDPNSVTGTGKWDAPWAEGTRDGIDIHVDFYPPNSPHAGKISTGYPTNTPINPP